MKKEAKDKHFLKQPVYEGGPKAMKKFVTENLRYPKEALEKKVQGTVSLRYDIDYKGNVVGTKVIAGLGHGCDEEAIRIVTLFKFKVEKPRGIRVLFHKTIKIHFRLPKRKPAPKTSNIQVSYTTTPSKKAATESPKKSSGYTITIPLQ